MPGAPAERSAPRDPLVERILGAAFWKREAVSQLLHAVSSFVEGLTAGVAARSRA